MLAIVGPADAVYANPGCKNVTGIAGGIENFLRRVGNAQGAGSGSLTLNEVLIGVSGIPPEDQRALAARGPVRLTKRRDTGGDFENSGPQDIQFQGVFAATATFFNVPRTVKGAYRWSPQEATFFYDPAHAIELGERILGIPMFRRLDHSVVSPNQLSFYFSGNAGGEADRCYIPVNY